MASLEPPASTVSAGSSTSGFKLVLKRSVPAPAAPAVLAPRPVQASNGPLDIPVSAPQPPLAPASTSNARVGAHQSQRKQTVLAEEPRHDGRGLELLEREARGVSSEKYRQLKRKLQEVLDNGVTPRKDEIQERTGADSSFAPFQFDTNQQSRDDTSLALYRAQKLIVRLREEKSALLDRVTMLEEAAGITADEISAAHEAATRHEREVDFPLLEPPLMTSTSDRVRPVPVNTSFDLTAPSYISPDGPSPPPVSLPPRLRSEHFISTVAAQKIRNNNEARRIARGLAALPYPVVSVLGLQGSHIAANVERALMGEAIQEQVDSRNATSSSKRKRESAGERITLKGKGRAYEALPPPASTGLRDLPNPFASFVGASAAGGRGDPQVIAAETVRAAAAVEAHLEEGYHSAGGGSVMSVEDNSFVDSSTARSGPTKPAIMPVVLGGRKPRKSADPGEKGPKAKRLKASVVTSGVYTIPHVPRNPDGTPRLPLAAGTMTLKNLGVISTRSEYSTERYFFPIGFHCMRRYPSMISKDAIVEYDCHIFQGSDGLPRFDLLASDQPGVVITAGTPTGAWSQVVKAVNKVRSLDRSGSVSGPDYYGLTHSVVKALVQELPGARDVSTYIWQTYVEEPPMPSASSRALKKALKNIGQPPKPRRASRGTGSVTPKPEIEYDDDEDEDDDDDDDDAEMNDSYQQNQHYDENDNDHSSRSQSLNHQSMSPGASSGYNGGESYVGGSGLSSLLHHANSLQANPYSLPIPSIDPSLAGSSLPPPRVPSSYDAYAIPPPIHSTTQADLDSLQAVGESQVWEGFAGAAYQ